MQEIRATGSKQVVIPAKAGIHLDPAFGGESKWIPAFAGITAFFGTTLLSVYLDVQQAKPQPCRGTHAR
jgi:hypothetical protein